MKRESGSRGEPPAGQPRTGEQGTSASARARAGTRRFRLLPFASLREGEGQAWMVTFTDLIALLLSFFVMLFAMMKVDDKNWQGLTTSLARELDGFVGPPVAQPRYARDSEAMPEAPAIDLDYLSALIGARLGERSDAAAYVVERGAAALIVRLPVRLAFAPGDAEPRAAATAAMAALAETLRNLDNRVEVAGHPGADDPAAPYASPWALSLARAAAVADILRAAGYDRPVAVRGYGVDSDDARRTRAGGRVDLLIHADSGTQEP